MTADGTSPPLRVAVVGTGIAGLSAGWLLAREGAEVTLFEKLDAVGMDAHCVTVERQDGSPFTLNTPPRSFSRTYYPNLVELYRLSGVETEPWSWSWVVHKAGADNPIIRVGRKFLFDWAMPTYVDMRHPWETLRLWRDGIRFSTACQNLLGDPKFAEMTVRDFVFDFLELSEAYVQMALLPTLSMVCTCSYEACLDYPAELVMQFYGRTATFGQYRTKYGTQDAVKKLTAEVARVLTGVAVKSISPGPDGRPVISYSHNQQEPGTEETFDHVIMATQANHGLYLIQDGNEELSRILKSFQHEESQVVIHRDPCVMPKHRAHWAPMSVGLSGPERSKDASMFTIWMNDSFPEIKGNLFQTWNPVVDIEPSSVVDEPITFERPIMRLETREALRALAKQQGKNGVWFCGAWNAWRIPLQESGVQSALAVARSILGRKPVSEASWVMPEDDVKLNKEARDAEALLPAMRASAALAVLATFASVAFAFHRRQGPALGPSSALV